MKYTNEPHISQELFSSFSLHHPLFQGNDEQVLVELFANLSIQRTILLLVLLFTEELQFGTS